MDHKTWLWRKRSSEKSSITTDKLDLSVKGNEEEIQILLADKAGLENDLKNLNDKLSSALTDCNVKDNLVKKHAKMTQEAIIGQKKVEVEAVSLKKELNEALEQRIADEERLTHLDAALKECMEQLRFVREEQEQRIHDAVMKASREFEKSQLILEDQLDESSKRLAKLGVENSQLSKALLAKEKLIDDLNKQRTQAEADFNALMTRLESTEKENASLKYEVRVLEKELEIRNEEREFNRRTADASHKQHLESVKKIAKLESECQRLRLLVQKRLPGPAALTKMKNEVEMLGRESPETRRKKFNSTPFSSMIDTTFDNSPDSPTKKIIFLTEHLCAMEEENKTLKEVLNKKINELHFSRSLYSRAASKLAEVESQLQEFSRGQKIMEPRRNSAIPYEVSLGSMSDIGSDDKVSCAESPASALISELEHLRRGKRDSPSCKTVGAPDISLMDDFVEMEKLAIVSANKPSENFHVSLDEKRAIVGPLVYESTRNSSKVMGRETVHTDDHQSDKEIKSRNILISKSPDWLQDILKLILEQTHVTEREYHEILEDIEVALEDINHSSTPEPVEAMEGADHLDTSKLPPVSSSTDIDISGTEKMNRQLPTDLSLSICKIVELIEGISLLSPDYGISETLSKKDGSVLPYKNAQSPSGYMVRIFQWKTSELGGVLQQFIHTCYDVLNQKTDFNKFAKEASTALDWIMNHCFSLQDVSSMEDAIKKHLNWDESRSASEAEVGMVSQFAEADRLHLPRENLSSLPMVALSDGNDNHLLKEELQSNVREENRKLRDENINVGQANKDMQKNVLLASNKGDFVVNQLQESQKIISSLQDELETLRKSKKMIEDQVKNHKLINEDLDTQLTAVRVELNEARQKFSTLEVKLESKQNYCEELEATCLELQLQHERATKKEIPSNELKQDEKQLRTDWEITAASEKLAECQETILNLGKQLKSLASPKEVALFDKVVSMPTDARTATTTTSMSTLPENKITSQRSSLLERMIAEDNAEDKDINSLMPKGSDKNYNPVFIPNGTAEPLEKIPVLNGNEQDEDTVPVGQSLAIVSSKKRGSGSLWKKLFSRKRKASSKKLPLPFAP